MMSNPRRLRAAIVVGLVASLSPAFGAFPVPSGGTDPYLPTGPAYASALRRPVFGTRPACSFRFPVCVHARREISAEVVLETLTDLERAAARLGGVLGLPTPLADGTLGGSSAFDLYLVPAGAEALAGDWVTTARDEADVGPFDRASAFALVREDTPARCVRPNVVARAFASAAAWGVDPAEIPSVREGNAAYAAEITAPCSAVTSALIDDFQRHPERALAEAGRVRGAAASLVLPWFLDVTLGSGRTCALPTALSVVAGQRTAPGDFLWNNEPDTYDALRATLKARSPAMPLDDLWMDFAIARLFLGSRDDGVHLPETAFAGDLGKIRFDWSIPFASLPRRVSPPLPLEPTGSTYLWIDLKDAPPGARLVFRAEWEAPVPFRWALVRVGADGAEASRVLVTPQQRVSSAEKYLESIDGLAGVAVVGVNVGDLALDDPFDPDQAPYEPHGYLVTLSVAPP